VFAELSAEAWSKAGSEESWMERRKVRKDGRSLDRSQDNFKCSFDWGRGAVCTVGQREAK
jgi:hypothetical protein